MQTAQHLHDLKWSDAERRIARQVFEQALQAELAEAVLDFQRRAAAVESAEAMWALAEAVQRRRRDIDAKYDFRYSQLLVVFARLVREGRVARDALAGLRDDKQDFLNRLLSL